MPYVMEHSKSHETECSSHDPKSHQGVLLAQEVLQVGTLSAAIHCFSEQDLYQHYLVRIQEIQ